MRSADPGLVADLGRILTPNRVLHRALDRLGRSSDASIYRLVPEVIVRPRDMGEVGELLAHCRRAGRHLTFRTAGTSLSGQAVSDDILVELAPFWNAHRVLDGGRRIWSQPGVVGGYLNQRLTPFAARIGPDPASIDAAMLGGIVSNNSSGMCAGVVQNSYHTLDALEFMLADGTVVDTARADADQRLQRECPALHAGLLALRDEIRANAPLAARIRKKFETKNTTGYSLHAFLDHDSAAQILAHLMVGAQGTLGFLAGITLRTVPEPPRRATGLVFFTDLREAGAAVKPLADAGAAAVEILDANCLRALESEHPYPFTVTSRTAALLTEFRAEDEERLLAMEADGFQALRPFALHAPARFSRDAVERAHLWKLRKGLFASAGAFRPPGTAFLTEDVAVPVARLAEAITDFQALFAEYEVPDTIQLGHAKDGNLHFVIAEDFRSRKAVDRYARFMEALADLVVGRYDGALKAEHGSGRNMAPFVRREWGDEAYALMKRVKALLDPDGILNPGVVLNDDPEAHLKDLKVLPTISPRADKCIECGFCEPRCPSRGLTLSPRQRIVVVRELSRLAARDDAEARTLGEELRADFEYEGILTCAGDSMCQTSCPVKIDTGALVKELRAESHSPLASRVALLAAEHFGLVASLARTGLRMLPVAGWFQLGGLAPGEVLVEAVTGWLNAKAPALFPRVARGTMLPRAAGPVPQPLTARTNGRSPRRVVYFPSCLSRILGPQPGEAGPSTAEAITRSLAWAGLEVVHPEGLSGLCCGMPFGSKGFADAAARTGERTLEALRKASDGGALPVVTDASPCAGTLLDLASAGKPGSASSPLHLPRVFDFAAFWAREVLPHLSEVPKAPGLAVLHPTCSLVKHGGVSDLLAVARAHAQAAEIPASAECCGFAGDRGFLVPELTRSATAVEGAEIRARLESTQGPASVFSTCRTCEIGMSRAVGRPVRSVAHLVHEAISGREAMSSA
jgi:D-lactate dehydrogenase